jgi:hypothetical protein
MSYAWCPCLPGCLPVPECPSCPGHHFSSALSSPLWTLRRRKDGANHERWYRNGKHTAANSLEGQRCVGRSAQLRVSLSPALDVSLFRCWLIYCSSSFTYPYHNVTFIPILKRRTTLRLPPPPGHQRRIIANEFYPFPPSHSPSPHLFSSPPSPHLPLFYANYFTVRSSCASCTAP